MTSRLSFCVLLLLLLGVGACSNQQLKDPRSVELAKMTYPEEAQPGDDMDIVVERKGGSIRLTNRTPAAYEKCVIWLNQQYVSPVDKLTIGAENKLSLHQFINRWREPFPVGGLLTPDKGYPVVLAELIDPATGKKHRLLVRKQ
ncbi:MAG: hypothetical protein K8S99_08355 [Planctomycetes bacterium]|nr:hypothetical protein [Planctomycetota bacterium]